VDSSTDVAIETSGLSKVFGKTRAVDSVDLKVDRGTIYGFLGPNGAGKTTTMRMLATLLRPDGGSARVFGHDVARDPDAVRSRISLTGQFASVDGDLSGMENLILLARLLGYSWGGARTRAHELLAAFGLSNMADRQVRQYSGGMRRRLDIAASLVTPPDLLFLDEPTTGLDPQSRSMIWEIVRTLVADGATVLLTTQYLEEADQLADRIAVIDHGKIIAEGTSAQLKASTGAGAVHVRLFNPEQRTEAKRLLSHTLGTSVRLEADPAALSVSVSAGPAADDVGGRVAHALAELSHSGITVADFALGQPSLDEVFLALTGRTADAAEAPTTEELAS
jgi:ABC-2 type transport system ATP-binding protein